MRSHLRLVHATDLPLEPPRRRDRRRAPQLHRMHRSCRRVLGAAVVMRVSTP